MLPKSKVAIKKSEYDKQIKRDKAKRVKKTTDKSQLDKPFVAINPNRDCSLNDVVKAADILGLELHIILSDKHSDTKIKK